MKDIARRAMWAKLSREKKLELYERAGLQRKFQDNDFSLKTLPLSQMNPRIRRVINKHLDEIAFADKLNHAYTH